MGVHRSRFELEQVLDRYGATDFAFVESDARSAVQFAIDGRYVELAFPLPDPDAPHFTHTASGRPRTVGAQERAYEQALREHWRGLLLAVRGKLQSVETGLSTFEDEFRSFLSPHLDQKKTKRERKRPRAVNWLLGGSHSLAIALVAAFLVPASAVGAFALPPTVVGHLAAPFRGALPHELGVPTDDARAVALGESIWARGESAPAPLARPAHRAHRLFAATLPQAEEHSLDASKGEVLSSALGGLRYGSEAPTSPPPPSPPAPPHPAPTSAPPPAPSPAEQPPPEAPAPVGEPPVSPAESGNDSPADEPSPPESGQDDGFENADPPAAPQAPPDNGKDQENGHDNGNHNGADNGNKNGNESGNGNGKAKGH